MAQTSDPANPTLAILAGGRGRRMGFAKSLLLVHGAPILQYFLETLQWDGPTLLVTAPGREHPPAWELFDAEAVDPIEQGPLRGILTALQHCRTPELIVITLDMLMLRQYHLNTILHRLVKKPELLGLMLSRPDGGPEHHIEPFPFACRAEAMEPIARHIESGQLAVNSLRTIPGFAAEPAPVNWPLDVWTNLNSPEEYERFVAGITKTK